MPAIQDYIKTKVVSELQAKLHTELGIKSLYIKPFNIIQLNDVYLKDRQDSVILNAKKVYADFELMPLLKKQLVISAAKLSDFDINLSKDSAKGKLNIQFIIDAFKPNNNSKKEKIDVKINAINILDGRFRFDVKDQPENREKFDPNHIEVKNLNAKIALKSLQSDSLNIQIKKLQLEERSGLAIKNLIARLITQKDHLSIKYFRLTLPKSQLQLEKCEVDYPQSLTPADFLNRASFESKIASSYITLKDVAAFVPAFKHFEDRVLFRTQLGGKLDSIEIANITLDYGDKMHLTAKGQIFDIRDQKKMFLKGNVEKLSLSKDGIISLLNNFSPNKKKTPTVLANLGDLTFKGNIEGYLNNLKADGNFQSKLGILLANAKISVDPNSVNSLSLDGKISTKDFELGKLLGNKDLEKISFDLMASLNKSRQGLPQASAKGIVTNFTYQKYLYHNIVIDGNYNGKNIQGKLSLTDPNGDFNIDGIFDLSKKNPKHDFHARLKNIRLDNLHLSNKYKEAYLSLAMNAKFSGRDIDDLQGYIKTDSIRFLQAGKEFKMDNFLIDASGYGSSRELQIQSDIINGKVTGAYSFTTIAESVKQSLNSYLPALISYNRKSKIKENNLLFNFTINNTESASDVFKLPFTVYEPSKITGSYNNNTNEFRLDVSLPLMQAGSLKISSGYLNIYNTDKEIKATIKNSFITKNGTVNDLFSQISAENNQINIHTTLQNKKSSQLKGEFSNTINFSKEKDKILQTNLHFDQGELMLNNTLWKIKDSDIKIKGSRIDVNKFSINSSDDEQRLDIDGTYSSTEDNQKLRVDLQKIDLDYVFNTLAIDALQFAGSASGNLDVSAIKGRPYADIRLDVDSFGFNKTTLGHLSLDSNLDNETLRVNLDGTITNSNNRKTQIDGFINPLTQELSIHFDADDVDVGFLNKYVSTLFDHVKGRGSGQVHLLGDFSNVTVEGKAFIDNGSLGVNFLNTNYSFTDTIFMKEDLIYFKDINFKDDKGNIAKVSGRVAHDRFSNFMYYIDLTGTNFMLYNVKENQNPMFYGTVFGSGTGVIKGDEKVLDINMSLRTEKNTDIFMNFMQETAAEYSFVTYKTRDQKTDSVAGTDKDKFQPRRLKTDSGMKMTMNFYIDATPDATIEFLMDPVGGDKLKGSGSGALQFIWGTDKDPMLYGTYQISKGTYNFTFQKILERKFAIQEGSSVQFRGDPFLANIDLTAVYRVTANLNDLDRNLALSTGQSNVPVNCLLNITGQLKHPSVKLDIALPSADPEVQRQVKSLINTEDMINRQIVYLLLLSKFYTPSYAVTDQRTSDFAAVASATLSAQLSKILSQIDDRWQIGTNIRTSDSEFSSTEVELVLSSRLLNDRVLFNGNFGYRDNLETANAFIGDVDIEVLLNRMGTWRLKAYNHYNEKYYYVRSNGSVQTQGLGIVYKKDFDSLRELFSRPAKKNQAEVGKSSTLKTDSISKSSTDSILSKPSAQLVKMKRR